MSLPWGRGLIPPLCQGPSPFSFADRTGQSSPDASRLKGCFASVRASSGLLGQGGMSGGGEAAILYRSCPPRPDSSPRSQSLPALVPPPRPGSSSPIPRSPEKVSRLGRARQVSTPLCSSSLGWVVRAGGGSPLPSPGLCSSGFGCASRPGGCPWGGVGGKDEEALHLFLTGSLQLRSWKGAHRPAWGATQRLRGPPLVSLAAARPKVLRPLPSGPPLTLHDRGELDSDCPPPAIPRRLE